VRRRYLTVETTIPERAGFGRSGRVSLPFVAGGAVSVVVAGKGYPLILSKGCGQLRSSPSTKVQWRNVRDPYTLLKLPRRPQAIFCPKPLIFVAKRPASPYYRFAHAPDQCREWAFARQVDVLSRAVEISADGRAPEVRAAFSSRVAEPKESFALGANFFRTRTERRNRVSPARLEGALRLRGATIGRSGKLILNDPRKGVFL
jgi:hypothetical protein